MTSVRFPSELEEQVRLAAAAEGESESEFIRAACAERAARVLGEDLSARLAGMIGAVASGAGSRAQESGEAFTDILVEKRRS
ncbi:MAG: hypothetical protein R2686_02355 [Candidatus Nanopelagicales bacterium]